MRESATGGAGPAAGKAEARSAPAQAGSGAGAQQPEVPQDTASPPTHDLRPDADLDFVSAAAADPRPAANRDPARIRTLDPAHAPTSAASGVGSARDAHPLRHPEAPAQHSADNRSACIPRTAQRPGDGGPRASVPAAELDEAAARALLAKARAKANTAAFKAWELESSSNADGLEEGCRVDLPDWRAESSCGVHHMHEEYLAEAPPLPCPAPPLNCSQWVVAVASPSDAVPRPPVGWCCVVVGVAGGPPGGPAPGVCWALTEARATRLPHAMARRLKGARGAVKAALLRNVAFLEAIRNGAGVIAETTAAALAALPAIPRLPESGAMVGEWDAEAPVIDPYPHFDAPRACSGAPPGRSTRGPPEDDPYFIHHDGAGRRYLSVQHPVFTTAHSPQTDCLCRVRWNSYHSKYVLSSQVSCRGRFSDVGGLGAVGDPLPPPPTHPLRKPSLGPFCCTVLTPPPPTPGQVMCHLSECNPIALGRWLCPTR